MCGFAGIIGRLDDENRLAVSRMAGAMEHRGPDAAGAWESEPDGEQWGCLLAHRRLSILDLSDHAGQPMTDRRTGDTIVYNGEIYGHRELRRSLEARGESIRSSGDTEVLLRSLTLDGERALPRLRGMFAFALWRRRERSLLLARDPLGMKPLYLCRNPDPQGTWSVAFASELRSVLHSGLLPDPRLDEAAVASVVWNGFVVGPGTAVRGVDLLPPATVVELDGVGATRHRRRYWDVPRDRPRHHLSRSELREVLHRGVADHLASDVPLGVFLSGGVDSSAVANIAHGIVGDGLTTFTLSFEERALDESRAAREIARAIGTDHREIALTGSDFGDQLKLGIDTLDQPTFDGLNSMYMSKAVREAGFTVALTGTGGDELFGGYKTFRQLPGLHRAVGTGAVPASVRRAAGRAIQLARRDTNRLFPPQTRWAKLAAMASCADDLVALYQLSYALFLPASQRRLLAPDIEPLVDGLPTGVRAELEGAVAARGILPAISWMEQRLFLGERLLRDSDAASMASSLELRMPLVDSVLTERVQALTVDDRYGRVGTKTALREIGLTGLDAALFDRPKRGFELPMGAWLRGELRDEVSAVLLDEGACARVGLDSVAVAALWRAFLEGERGLYWTRVWTPYVLISWAVRHGLSR